MDKLSALFVEILQVHLLLQRLLIGLHGLRILHQGIGRPAQLELPSLSYAPFVHLIEQLLLEFLATKSVSTQNIVPMLRMMSLPR